MPGPGNLFRQLVSDSHPDTHEHDQQPTSIGIPTAPERWTTRRRKSSWIARLLSASRSNKKNNIDIHIDTSVGTGRTISPDPRSGIVDTNCNIITRDTYSQLSATTAGSKSKAAPSPATAISSILEPSFSESPSQSAAGVLDTNTSVTTPDSSSLSVSIIKSPTAIITPTTTSPPGAGGMKPSCRVLPNDSTTTAALSRDRDLWRRTLEIAEKNLARANLPSIRLEDPSLWSHLGAENIQLILKELNTAHDRYQSQRHVFMGRRWGRILKSMEKYAKVVDTAIQHQPEITALVWAGVRTLLQVALNHVQAIECFEAIIVTIMDKMATCTFYANIYSEALVMPIRNISNILSILDSALPELYAAVIVFAVKARIYFEARWLKKIVSMFKPFLDEFQPFMDDISEKESTVRNCADMVIMQTITRHSDTLRQMQNNLNAMRTEMEALVKLDEISQAITQNVDLSKELVMRSLSVEGHLLLQQLSPLEPLKRHSDIRSVRLKDTGNWLLELNQFRNWRDIQTAEGKNERVLCCYGIPGAGKTIISSLVIDHLRSQVTTQSKTAVVCLYADYRDQGNQTVVHILGALLHQYLTSGHIEIPNKVTQTLTDIKKQNKSVELEDVLDMLRVTLVQLDRSFVCIDGIDELEARTRRELLGILPKALSIGKTSIRFFLTGRPHVKGEVQSFFSHSQLQEVDITANLDDIRIYLRYKITQDESVNSETMNERLKREIETTIVAQSQGMFLLPALHVHMVLEQPTIAKRRRVLKDLPPDLHQALEEIVSRIQASRGQSELGMRVLMWLHLASRPLKLRELQHALAIEKGNTRFDEDNIPSRKALLNCCLGLVIVDEETQTVRFVHYSLGEFFHKNNHKYFPNGFSTAAETCLTYLNFPEVRKHCTSDADMEKRLKHFSFLEYAAENWGEYLRKQSNPVQNLSAQKILLDNPSEGYCCPRQVLHRSMYESIFSRNHRVSGIHVAAFFGLHKMMNWCCDVWVADSRDHIGRTPLLWAASRGHEAVVQLLIDRKDVDLNAKDQICRTPLSLAAGRGHVTVVRLLIERHGVDLNPKSIFGITPLIDAAISGYAAVVQLLIEQDGVDLNAMDEHCRTPLLWAAHMGHEGVVQVLIERDDVDLNPKSYFNTTPLMLAAKGGHKSVVQMLIERDGVDLNAVNGRGRTALAIALLLGHQSIAQLLQTKQPTSSCPALPPAKE